MDLNRALAGVRVLDLSRLLPGPYLTMVMADLGADVVKVEDPRIGDYMRQIPPLTDGVSRRFHAVNRGKRSLALDLKSDSGKATFLQMAQRADVVVESFRPGVMDKLGVGWDALSKVNPRLVLCSISGFGQTGPMSHRAGHDLGYLALAGVLAMGGSAGGAPAMPGVQIADLAGGALWGLVGVLGALLGRERSGQGEHLDISMTEGAMALLAAELANLAPGEEAPTRGRAPLNGGLACYSIYRTADDRYLAVGALEPKFWIAFNTAIGRTPDLSELVLPADGQERVRQEVQAILSQKTRDQWQAIFDQHDCCTEAIFEMDELEQHPLHRARGVFHHGAESAVPMIKTPVANPRMDRPAPALGQHSREVLLEYGVSDGSEGTNE